MSIAQIVVPDLGDFADVPVIEVLVAPGDTVAVESPLIALESDKATMEVPSPRAGVVHELLVAVGQTVSAGTPILTLEVAGDAADAPPPEPAPAAGAAPPAPAEPAPGPVEPPPAPTPSAPAPVATAPPSPPEGIEADVRTALLVIGAGPGGYTAAFRAADLGVQTILIERDATLGGVCLNVGCIPSKALLHVAAVIADAADAAPHGVRFGAPEIDLDALRAWKDDVVGGLTAGLTGLARARKVEVVRGSARFIDANRVRVETDAGATTIAFSSCIVAVGSRPIELPGFPDDPRVMDSTGALELADVPRRLLVVGGGIIGLEMATVYEALGSAVTVVELADQLIPGCDPDLVAPLAARISERYAAVHLGVRVEAAKARKDGILVSFEGDGAPDSQVFDRVLVAVGRRPNGDLIDAPAAGIAVDERGFIAVDRQLRTNVGHIHAIGDVVGQPMLAHKATHEAKAAAEVVAGHAAAAFDAASIPSVAYTDPEIAWTGLTETRAAAEGIAHEVARFPWIASGRALSIGRSEGLTKLVVDPDSRRVLGAGIVGRGAGELIAEVALAIEMGADASDLALTIHPHPTLSESVGMAAEVADGSITDLPPARRRARRA